MKFPQAKAAAAALLPIGQLIVSLFADQTLTADELKLIGVEVGAVVLVWLVPAKGYAAPGEVAVPAEMVKTEVKIEPPDHEHTDGPTGHWEMAP
jgi:hypothetical protein